MYYIEKNVHTEDGVVRIPVQGVFPADWTARNQADALIDSGEFRVRDLVVVSDEDGDTSFNDEQRRRGIVWLRLKPRPTIKSLYGDLPTGWAFKDTWEQRKTTALYQTLHFKDGTMKSVPYDVLIEMAS